MQPRGESHERVAHHHVGPDEEREVEPLEGAFPLPLVGPFKLLKQTRINHMGKLAFRWMYWYLLLKGIPMPGISHNMSMMGKKAPR